MWLFCIVYVKNGKKKEYCPFCIGIAQFKSIYKVWNKITNIAIFNQGVFLVIHGDFMLIRTTIRHLCFLIKGSFSYEELYCHPCWGVFMQAMWPKMEIIFRK
jgi:hypothetical protein